MWEPALQANQLHSELNVQSSKLQTFEIEGVRQWH